MFVSKKLLFISVPMGMFLVRTIATFSVETVAHLSASVAFMLIKHLEVTHSHFAT